MEVPNMNSMRDQTEEILLMRNLPIPENNASSSSGSFNDVESNPTILSITEEMVDKAVQTDDQTELEMENSGTTTDLPLYRLQNQFSAIMVSATKELMEKVEKFNDEVVAQEKLAQFKETERNIEEKQALSEEIKQLEYNAETLQTVIRKNSEQLQCLDKKLEKAQNNKTLLKYLLRWKAAVMEKKDQKFRMWIATQHFEKNLKKKAFNFWIKLMKLGWGKRLELKIMTEVYENQKSIVQSYETKIQTLQENAFEVDKRLKTLHKSLEGSVQTAFMQGVSYHKEQISNSDLAADNANRKPYAEEDDGVGGYSSLKSLCVQCSSYRSDSSGESNLAFSDKPPVNYRHIRDVIPKSTSKIHPSALPKCLPVMGTYSNRNKTTTVTLCPDVQETVTVERHIQTNELSTPYSPRKTPILKIRGQKKHV